ncbi:Alpha/beta-Hydrolases superfamily protein [Hibiscus syriacus]|uniref:Alpha/beta-Hydrolases superfamily protein n=1 Tax=Hibiscus syriacus TaxID=106335 RepID=A0A6A2Z192_HIBSY|nr:Alpha/beta-Hydrolases superfamily protein [Hibiscus syriacus]
MDSAFQLTLLHLLVLFSLVCGAKPLCLPDERTALLQFKQSFIIHESASTSPYAYPKTQSWKQSGGDCCSWNGVACDNNTGHVIGLNLSSSYLYGSINSSTTLFRLAHLRSLNLGDNSFIYSEIPSGIRNLSRLTLLDLSYSHLSGQVPWEILELSMLEVLDLSGNSLKLWKPGFRSLLHKLSNLKELYLADVKISSSVPSLLANFSSLTVLNLSNCELRGEFPTGIFELPSLAFLSLELNQELSGTLPDKVPENHPLLILSLASTSFSGQLPESIGNFSSMEHLDISNCRLSGKLPYSIGNLTQLKHLDLFSNNFSGPIPSSIGNLNQLEFLEFSENKFSGQIPSLANLTLLDYLSLAANSFDQGNLSWIGTQTKLTYLDLSSPNLTAQIPSSLQNLTQITYLYLSSNKLNGRIPPRIGSLTKLIEIKFYENNLSGPIPYSIFKLRNLELLYLHANQLNGALNLQSFLELKISPDSNYRFPSFLRGQDELEILKLADNKIHGQIPSWFWGVGEQTLQYLDLGLNSLTGFQNLPAVLPWTSLIHFNLEFNMLKGSLPRPPPSISSYRVANNHLSGEIPPIFCNLSSILVLDLSNNNMTGMLPPCLASLAESLEVLNLQSNHFTGAIPPKYPKNCRLKMMDISRNQLQGRIPRSLAHCNLLEELILGNNLINDSFPYWLGGLPKLKVLSLRSNRLHGVIGKPQTKSDFSKLQVIDLSNNHLTGKLPFEYFNVWNAMKIANTSSLSQYMFANTSSQIKNYAWYAYYNYTVTLSNKGRDLRYEKVPDFLAVIDLSSNEFEGEIPESIGDLKLIRILNFSNNNLGGRVPFSLGEISNLESLDISRNNLQGKIPPQLSKLNFLATFNVSYNQLAGPIPQGAQFNTFNNDSYEGNSGLCGYPLSKCGNPGVPFHRLLLWHQMKMKECGE